MDNKRIITFKIGGLIALLLFGFSFSAQSQIWQELKTPYDYDHLAAKKTFLLPTGCGEPTGLGTLLNNKLRRAAIYYDSCAKKVYFFDPTDTTWAQVSGSGGVDTTSLSNRINLKVNISDTSDMLAGYTKVTRLLDSLSAIRSDINTKANQSALVDTAAAIRLDFPTTPSLQQATDIGYTTTKPIVSSDSIKARELKADSMIHLPVRDILDTLSALAKQGSIMFDSVSKSVWVKIGGEWTALSSLTNSLIPNRPNMRLIAGVIRPGVIGSTIQWNWIINSTHDSIGFGAVGCNGTDVLLTLKEEAVKIHTIVAVPDEQLARAINVGVSFQTTQALLRIYRRFGVKNTVLRGNGTTYVKTDGGGSSFTMSFSSGDVKLDWQSAYSTSAYGVYAQYIGSNGYHLERQTSGLSGYDGRWLVKDPFGNTVTANPTTSDMIDVIVPEEAITNVNPCLAGGDGWAAATFDGFSNIWVFGLVEY